MSTAALPSPERLVPGAGRRSRARGGAAALLLGLLPASCVMGPGEYVWVDQFPVSSRPPVGSAYVIEPGDTISVRVYNQDGMSARVKVREDGKVSLLFLNDVQAAGHTPKAFADQLQVRLKEFIVNPVVNVSLEEARPFEVFVVGEVARAGRVALEPHGTVLQALAAAGGLTENANRDRIFVVRTSPEPARIRFRYDSLTRLEGRSATFLLRPGDTIVVE